ncbi:MAG TPA: hypothetical protein GXX19_02910 [Syntrophomonadaceae bacterium]|nr:hypothetical protein [Syntrophomonadaceae bacterium]
MPAGVRVKNRSVKAGGLQALGGAILLPGATLVAGENGGMNRSKFHFS